MGNIEINSTANLNESIVDSIRRFLFGDKITAALVFYATANNIKIFENCFDKLELKEHIIPLNNNLYALIIDKEVYSDGKTDEEKTELIKSFTMYFIQHILCTRCNKIKDISFEIYAAFLNKDENTAYINVLEVKKCKITQKTKNATKTQQNRATQIASYLYIITDSEMFKAYYKNDFGKHILELNYDPLGILTAKNKDEIIYTMREIIEDIIDITYFNDNDIVYSVEHINEEENTKRYGNNILGIEEFVLTEAVSKKVIPAKIKELIKSKTIRKKMLLRCGKDAFLLPEELKFPVKYPVLDRSGNVKKCEYHCGLIIAAYYRANEWKKKKPEYIKVAEKAKELYKKLKCDEDKKLPVHIRLNEQYIPDDIAIFTLVDLLDKIR